MRDVVRAGESIRIALLVWDLSISGGSQRQALELARYLMGRGHVVRVYCGYLSRSKCYPDLLRKLDVVCLHERDYVEGRNNFLRWVLYPPEPLFTGQAKALADMMPDGGFDLVNCHDFMVYRSAYYYKRANKVPVVWMVNDLPRSLVGPKSGLGGGSMKDLLHYLILGGPLGHRSDLRRVRALDKCVVFDKPTAEAFAKKVGVAPVRMGSGLDSSVFECRPRSKAPDRKKLKVLDVGVFYPHRRYEDLLNAVALAKKDGVMAEVMIVGSDAYDKIYASRTRELASALGLQNEVKFICNVTEEELRRLYADADVFVFPNYPQTWGLAPFEAMASGTPVIVSTGAGASEVMTDGENALLVPPGRPEAIASCLVRLCDDGELYVRLSRNGRRFVEENISWNAYGMRMEALFKETLSKPGGEK